MIVYFKTMSGDILIEKGQIFGIGGVKSNYLVTGNDKNHLEVIGNYKTREEAKELFDAIIAKIVSPTLLETQKGVIYIDLEHIMKKWEVKNENISN